MPPEQVAQELAELRRELQVGFAEQRGQLALLVQRGDQADKTLADHEARLDALEKSRWPLPSLAALVSLAALGMALWQAASS